MSNIFETFNFEITSRANFFIGTPDSCSHYAQDFLYSLEEEDEIEEKLEKLSSSEKKESKYFESALSKLGNGSSKFLTSKPLIKRIPYIHFVMNTVKINNGFAEALLKFGRQNGLPDLINIGSCNFHLRNAVRHGETPLLQCINESDFYNTLNISSLKTRVKFLIDKLGANPNICDKSLFATPLSVTVYKFHKYFYGNQHFKQDIKQGICHGYLETMKSLIRRSGIITKSLRDLDLEGYQFLESTLLLAKKEIDEEDLKTAVVLMNSSPLCKNTATLVAQYFNDTYEDETS